MGQDKTFLGTQPIGKLLFWLAVLAAWHAIHNDPQLFYERWTHTCLVSTVPQRKSPAESCAKLPGKD